MPVSAPTGARKIAEPPQRDCRWTILDLGLVPYAQALALQSSCREDVLAGHPGYWLVLQHPSVVTTGRRADALADLPVPPNALQEAGIDFARTDRGGRLTYHYPGQLVVYPILHLRRERILLRQYIAALADLVVGTLHEFGLQAEYRSDHPGVWIGHNGTSKKTASIGVHVSRSVTTHGFALNVLRNPKPIQGMKLCGMATDSITSMEELLRRPPALDQVKRAVIDRIVLF